MQDCGASLVVSSITLVHIFTTSLPSSSCLLVSPSLVSQTSLCFAYTWTQEHDLALTWSQLYISLCIFVSTIQFPFTSSYSFAPSLSFYMNMYKELTSNFLKSCKVCHLETPEFLDTSRMKLYVLSSSHLTAGIRIRFFDSLFSLVQIVFTAAFSKITDSVYVKITVGFLPKSSFFVISLKWTEAKEGKTQQRTEETLSERLTKSTVWKRIFTDWTTCPVLQQSQGTSLFSCRE